METEKLVEKLKKEHKAIIDLDSMAALLSVMVGTEGVAAVECRKLPRCHNSSVNFGGAN